MSHPVNEQLLEDYQVRFDELKDGNARAALLTDMRHSGFGKAADTLVTSWYLERLEYLDQLGVEEKDVLVEDSDPKYHDLEYFLEQQEFGTPGDDYQVRQVKHYLPTYLNVDYWIS